MTRVDEAVALQVALAPSVIRTGPVGFTPRIVAGLDVAYGAGGDRVAAAVACVDLTTLSVVDHAVVLDVAEFPYVPGLFAFRELPPLLKALAELGSAPDLLVCDGQGLAHPRRFGLACHAGVVTGLPSIGVGKQALGRYDPPGPDRGDWTDLTDGGEVVGRALRTQAGVKPVFVSIGHRIDLDLATEVVLRLSPRFRLPEAIRAADRLGRQALRSA
ncbi:endonuclease V [Actinophytocola sp.]|uniref:endonuclease V n=1 Tax=Actinophytocola sp. TaxID=1872138 RepID=UPI002D7F3FB4|nr:endonuclease V [Actinophytocola sp.]HET9138328.1 endonuclease V [Actinophytocola sp.]